MARGPVTLDDLFLVAMDLAIDSGRVKLAEFLRVLAANPDMFDKGVTAVLTGGRDYVCDKYKIPPARREKIAGLLGLAETGVEGEDLRVAILDVAEDELNYDNVGFGNHTIIERVDDNVYNVLCWGMVQLPENDDS